MLGVLAVLLSLLVSCTDLINLSQGLDDLYEGMKPTLAKSEPEQKAEPENEPEQEPEKEPKNVDLVELSVSLNTINTDSLWGYDLNGCILGMRAILIMVPLAIACRN